MEVWKKWKKLMPKTMKKVSEEGRRGNNGRKETTPGCSSHHPKG
jgi:hypothetical protein